MEVGESQKKINEKEVSKLNLNQKNQKLLQLHQDKKGAQLNDIE